MDPLAGLLLQLHGLSTSLEQSLRRLEPPPAARGDAVPPTLRHAVLLVQQEALIQRLAAARDGVESCLGLLETGVFDVPPAIGQDAVAATPPSVVRLLAFVGVAARRATNA